MRKYLFYFQLISFIFLVLFLNFNICVVAKSDGNKNQKIELELDAQDGTEFQDESEQEVFEQDLDSEDIQDFDFDDDDISLDDLDEIEKEEGDLTFKQKMSVFFALVKVKADNAKNHVKEHKKEYGIGSAISLVTIIIGGGVFGVYFRSRRKKDEK